MKKKIIIPITICFLVFVSLSAYGIIVGHPASQIFEDIFLGNFMFDGNLSVTGNIVASDPVDNSHVATKSYVDANSGGAMPSLENATFYSKSASTTYYSETLVSAVNNTDGVELLYGSMNCLAAGSSGSSHSNIKIDGNIVLRVNCNGNGNSGYSRATASSLNIAPVFIPPGKALEFETYKSTSGVSADAYFYYRKL